MFLKGQEMDYSTIIVALIAFAGTVYGSYKGNSKTQAVVTYRLEELEKKVNKHNNLVERMFKVEEDIEVHAEKIKVANHRIEDLEKGR